MRFALLGSTGVTVSRLALGTMTFGGDADEGAAAAILDRAREAGVNFVDTADVYNDGRAEEILGRLLRGCRDEIVLASKAYYPTGPDRNARGSSRRYLQRAVESSLRRLSTDRIDVYYLHAFDEHTDIGESLRVLDDLVRAGKIVYPACSNFAAWQIAHALGLSALNGWARLCAIQPMYNLLKRQAEVEILPMAAGLGVAAVTYGPLAGGLLSGKHAPSGAPADGTRFSTDAMYQARYRDRAHWQTAAAFAALATEAGYRPTTLAVAWAASHPAVTAVLLGARNVGQLEDSLAAADINIEPELRTRVASLTPDPPPATDRSEERALA